MPRELPPNSARALIVNADDFGLTAGVNRAIIEAHTHGIVTSATLMANMPAYDEAVALARAHPSLGIGLHFNLTQGQPVAPAEEVKTLLNADGEFLGTSTALARRAWLGGLKLQHVETELRAQLEKAIASGLTLTHADSHKHAHALPQIFALMLQVLPAYGLAAIRLPRESWRGRFAWQHPKLFKQSLTALALQQLGRANARALAAQDQMRATNAFLGLAQTGFWSMEWLRACLTQLPPGATELMCHPGYDDAGLQAAGTRLRAAREAELRWLTNPVIAALVRAQGIRLIHFGELGALHAME